MNKADDKKIYGTYQRRAKGATVKFS